MSALRLTDAVCIVTGASSGIGAATARRLGAAGAVVVLAARRGARLERLAAELPRALAVPTDVTAPGRREHLLEATLAAYGRVDVLVNDAGQGLHVPLLELDPQDLRAVYELNVVAPLRALQLVFPTMRARARARSSMSAPPRRCASSPASRATRRPSPASTCSLRSRAWNSPTPASACRWSIRR